MDSKLDQTLKLMYVLNMHLKYTLHLILIFYQQYVGILNLEQRCIFISII